MEFLLALIIPALSFVLQAYPRLFNRYFGVDVWTRLIEIDHVRRAKHKIPGKITKGFIIDGNFDYPLLFPLMFSYFPKKFLVEYQGFIAPLFDVINNLLVFVFAFYITQNVVISLIAQLIYTLTPMIAVENSNLTPRSFGYTNFSLAFFPLLIYSLYGNLTFLLIGLFFTSTLFLTHRFAAQSFFFASLFFLFVRQNPIFIESFLVGFVIAAIVTKGYYFRVLKGHLYNIYFWIVNYRYRFAHQVYGNQKPKQLDWVGKVYYFLSVFSPLFIFGINCWIISGFIYFFLYIRPTSFLPIVKNGFLFESSLLILFFYTLAAIVLKVKRLIPIGEGQRYLEMATIPTAILSSVIFMSLYNKYQTPVLVLFIAILLGNLAMILVIQIKGIIKDKNRSLTDESHDIFRFINKLKGTPRIICIPHQMSTLIVYHTKADVLVNADNPGLMELSDFYPILQKTPEELAKKYKLTHLLLRETFVKYKDIKMKKPKIIFRSGETVLIKL